MTTPRRTCSSDALYGRTKEGEGYSTIFSEKLCLCLFYRPPSSPVSTFDKLCTILHLLNPFQFSNLLILGDFKVNVLDQKSYLCSYVKDGFR